VRKGGLLVIPIFVVAVFGLLLIAERIYHLYIRSSREIAGVSRIISMVGNASEEDIEKEIESMGGKPIGRVLGAVFSARNTDRNVRADILEQSLINESTLLERNLSLLTAVAAIAPMLGLIGTVTGMISTFHAITIFGSGDPRMMAGGISEALTTTMLGLTVAVPVMLVNTLLNRRAETLLDSLQKNGMYLHNVLGGRK